MKKCALRGKSVAEQKNEENPKAENNIILLGEQKSIVCKYLFNQL